MACSGVRTPTCDQCLLSGVAPSAVPSAPEAARLSVSLLLTPQPHHPARNCALRASLLGPFFLFLSPSTQAPFSPFHSNVELPEAPSPAFSLHCLTRWFHLYSDNCSMPSTPTPGALLQAFLNISSWAFPPGCYSATSKQRRQHKTHPLHFRPPSGHDQGATFTPSLVVLTESPRGRILDLSDLACSSPHPPNSVLSVGPPLLYLLLPPPLFSSQSYLGCQS